MNGAKHLAVSLLDICLAVVTLFLGARIILKLISANPATPIVSWIYLLTDSLIYPFQNIFPALQTGGLGVFDVTAVITLVAYILVFYIIIYLINLIPETHHHTPLTHEHTKEI